MADRRLSWTLVAALAAVTLFAFWPVTANDFINFDDPDYVVNNRYVQAGLTGESLTWAFSTSRAANWHPLTWLSHMLDFALFGLDPGKHHLSSLVLHAVNAGLLLIVLGMVTGAVWRSALAAALFAVHPLHVESVAWIAERKDVLSAFFLFLTLMAYVRYIRKPGTAPYLAATAFFALGLMSKPMLVTLPFLLLLLDYWPLGRFRVAGANGRSFAGLFMEKMPLLALSLLSSVITYLVQAQGTTLASWVCFPFMHRVGNALVSYVMYLFNMIWPAGLAFYYPHPGGGLRAWQWGGAALLLGALTILAIGIARRRPYFITGWFWYLGALFPVIGLIQVGLQARADRYTYITMTGLFVAAAWGLAECAVSRLRLKAALAAGVLVILVAVTRSQVTTWKDSETLFRRAAQATTGNFTALYNLGTELYARGKYEEAASCYSRALDVMPLLVEARVNLGSVLIKQRRFGEAVEHLNRALKIKREDMRTYFNLGLAYTGLERPQEAAAAYREAVRIDPGYVEARFNLGYLYLSLGRRPEALAEYEALNRLDPAVAARFKNLLDSAGP